MTSAGTATYTFTLPALMCPAKSKDPVSGKYRADPRRPHVPKLVGYYAKGPRPDFARSKEYDTWKAYVLRFAPRTVKTLNPAGHASRVQVDVWCYFPDPGTKHADPENVRKGIIDAIYGKATGKDDRWVFGYHHFPEYDPARPRVVVRVTRYDTQEPLL